MAQDDIDTVLKKYLCSFIKCEYDGLEQQPVVLDFIAKNVSLDILKKLSDRFSFLAVLSSKYETS